MNKMSPERREQWKEVLLKYASEIHTKEGIGIYQQLFDDFSREIMGITTEKDKDLSELLDKGKANLGKLSENDEQK